MNWYHRYVGFSFILIVLALSVVLLARPQRDYSSQEKRNLSKRPALTLSTLTDGSFMDGMEDYAADQFPARNAFMTAKTGLLRLLGDRESQGVYLCKDDSLMERFDRPDQENMDETIREMAAFAARHENSAFYFLLAPTAPAIYPERLPKNAPMSSEDDYIDAFYQGLGERFSCVDIREKFLSEKDRTQLYYRTDHHWTTDGAFIAYGMLSDAMGLSSPVSFHSGTVTNDFFGSLSGKSGYQTKTADSIKVYLPDYPEELKDESYYTVTYADTLTKAASCYETDALLGDDPYQVFFGSNHPLITIETSADTERKLLILKDSYANCLIPFLIPSYKNITVVDPRYYYDDIDALMISGQFDEVLFLYNANTLSTDTSLKTVLRNQQ